MASHSLSLLDRLCLLLQKMNRAAFRLRHEFIALKDGLPPLRHMDGLLRPSLLRDTMALFVCMSDNILNVIGPQ